jgi:peptidoglycan hydrolase-like protein with peptidoglycan-binding domain
MGTIIPKPVAGKTNVGLVAYCDAQLGLPYWNGTFGQIASAALYEYEKARAPKYYTATDFPKQYGLRVHDCGGLIKGYLWSETPTSSPKFNSAQDCNAEMFYQYATEKGELTAAVAKKLKPGMLVYNKTKSHVAVYKGDFKVDEARGHSYGVVESKLDLSRFKWWSNCVFVTYEKEPEPAPAPVNKITIDIPPTLKNGSKGKAVKVWQEIVGVTADGVYGSKSISATKDLQKKAGIQVDGIVGKDTWTAGLNTL